MLGLTVSWFDANYNWGIYNPETRRWEGVIGHTLYGDIDVGMSNIDMVHARYQVIDYSHFMRLADIRVRILSSSGPWSHIPNGQTSQRETQIS